MFATTGDGRAGALSPDLAGVSGGDVLEDPAQVAKSERCVESLGHWCRLQARRCAPALERVAQELSRHAGCETATACVLERADVVDAAVAVELERDRGGDALAVQPCDRDAIRGRVGT